MKYLVYAGELCCPEGGHDDLIGSIDSLDDLSAILINCKDDWGWYHVVKATWSATDIGPILKVVQRGSCHWNDDTNKLEVEHWFEEE